MNCPHVATLTAYNCAGLYSIIDSAVPTYWQHSLVAVVDLKGGMSDFPGGGCIFNELL